MAADGQGFLSGMMKMSWNWKVETYNLINTLKPLNYTF